MICGLVRESRDMLFKPRSSCELTAKLTVKVGSMNYDSTYKVGFTDDCRSE